jgi:hypothetical protein
MIVEDERSANVDHIYNTNSCHPSDCIDPAKRQRTDFSTFAQNKCDIRNLTAHYQLRNDLIAHLWARKGRDETRGIDEDEDSN